MINKKEQQRGFTLLETLMAISVISISIIGPLAMAASASRLISTARNQLTAVYLAQEAVELVRYKRDSNMLGAINNPGGGIGWLDGLDNCINSREDSCFVDPVTPTFYSCDSFADLSAFGFGSCEDAFLTYTGDDAGGGYKYAQVDAPGKTSFQRFIQIEKFSTDLDDVEQSAAKVRVVVKWADSYGPKTIYVQENIYNYL